MYLELMILLGWLANQWAPRYPSPTPEPALGLETPHNHIQP